MTGLSSLFAYGILAQPITLGLLLLLALILFGNRLPSMMRSLGRSVVEFKKGVAGIEDEINDATNKTETKPSSDTSSNSSEV
ncbi:MAG: twin-arginine translocase TatA/TatE family subunit [Planctomycetaceae bacterium]|jgi:sec-independent protein translocase protein TatA|nr:twin-arginine translocase TatA/TatE family subunit [Planctomycetaceae bacterium]